MSIARPTAQVPPLPQELPDGAADAIDACRRTLGAPSALSRLAGLMGFDGLSYLVLAGPPPHARVAAHRTSAGEGWTARYATRAYHLVDPRLRMTQDRAVPVAWSVEGSASGMRDREFGDDAASHAIASGIAWSVHDGRGGRAVIAWDFGTLPPHGHARPRRIALGTLALAGGLLHEGLAAQADPPGARPPRVPLTDRERECVSLVARGMTSADVGAQLGISVRTANFHVGNAMSKLGAMSRSEAIARAMAANLVRLDA